MLATVVERLQWNGTMGEGRRGAFRSGGIDHCDLRRGYVHLVAMVSLVIIRSGVVRTMGDCGQVPCINLHADLVTSHASFSDAEAPGVGVLTFVVP